TTYNDADQPVTTTTTLQQVTRTLITHYDELGRKTGTWDSVNDVRRSLRKRSLPTSDPYASGVTVAGTSRMCPGRTETANGHGCHGGVHRQPPTLRCLEQSGRAR
ncbi:hypothetical protein, partial [Streptomyces glomeratus]